MKLFVPVVALTLGLAVAARAEEPQSKPAAKAPAAKEPAAKAPAAPKGDAVVEMKTTLGSVKIKLDAEKAPVTVQNFLRYVDEKLYDGTVFHRVIDGFMIQGGGLDKEMTPKKTHDPITLESQNGLKNVRGSVAMARTGDPNSATSQFFINVVDNGRLDHPNPDGHGYAVFGHVIEGLDVVDKIKAVKTATKGMHQNVPVETVEIVSVRRVQ